LTQNRWGGSPASHLTGEPVKQNQLGFCLFITNKWGHGIRGMAVWHPRGMSVTVCVWGAYQGVGV